MSEKPKNLLFIFSDQHSRRVTGCYGHPIVKTPHLDRLAEEGTIFKNAYCNAPICVPSRGSLATGRYVNDPNLEVWDNCSPYFGQVPSWGHRLMVEGYHVVSIGKLHYRNKSDPNGFDKSLIPLHVYHGVGNLYNIVRDPLPTANAFQYIVKNAGVGNTTYLDYDRRITEHAINWLKKKAQHETNKPWVLFVSLVCPHPPWIAPSKFYDLYPHKDIDMPQLYRLNERPMHLGLEDFRQYFGVRGTFDEKTLRKVIASYYGMISFLDDNIGKIISVLEETGLSGNASILYTSDHGESMGQKGMFSKCNMYEESVGVPMIISGPDFPTCKEIVTPVQLIDIFPTILEATGSEIMDEDKELPGKSLQQIAHGDKPERVIFSEQHCAGAKSAVFMLRRGDWKYVRYLEDYPPQLFNLVSDPNEYYDLAAYPNFQKELDRCEVALRDLIDPEGVDQRAKAKQSERIEVGGGVDAVLRKTFPGYTPIPSEVRKHT